MYQKEKNRQYIDSKRKAQKRNLAIGEKVLIKQDKQDKLATMFHHQPHTQVNKAGNQVIVQSPEGVTKMRNSTHVKKFIEREEMSDSPSGIEQYEERPTSDLSLTSPKPKFQSQMPEKLLKENDLAGKTP